MNINDAGFGLVVSMLLFLLGFACTTTTPDPPSTIEAKLAGGRLTIDTSASWSLPAWAVKRDKLKIIRTQATINIPADRPLKGSVLELEGAWYNIELSVNGKPAPPKTGGLMPVSIPIGDLLVPGENRFDLTLSPPHKSTSSRLTGGRLFATHKDAQQAKIMRPPKLILRPENHIRSMALDLNGEMVTPKARVNAPNGSKVQFELWLDGIKQADLGVGSVENDLAIAPPTTWELPKWEPNAPQLFILKGTLIDQEEQHIDMMSLRTGVKETRLSTQGLSWNGKRFEMLAGRMQGHDSPKSLGERLKPMTQGGINSVEIHGEMLRSDWLDFFDENGVPVAFTPRCIGRTNYKNDEETDQSILSKQDQRFIEAIESRPSVALGVIEGKDSIPLWTNTLQESLNKTPIAGLDIPSSHVRMDLKKGISTCQPSICDNHWIVEVALAHETAKPPWPEIVSRFDSLTRSGIAGSVIPLPKKLLAKLNPESDREWASAWKSYARSKGIQPLIGGQNRAKSKVKVTGLSQGDVLIGGIAGQSDVGSIADANGEATLELWHRGEVKVSSSGQDKTASLMPSNWSNFRWEGVTTTVKWSK